MLIFFHHIKLTRLKNKKTWRKNEGQEIERKELEKLEKRIIELKKLGEKVEKVNKI